MKRRMLVIFASVFFLLPVMAAAQNFEFPVECERLLRNHRGTLVITADGIEYRTSQKNESRSWRYKDIQQIKIESPTVLEILTYEDQRRMLGRDRIFRFRLLEGKITPEVSALLVAKAARPAATSVTPVTDGEPKYETAVKHLHTFGGCEGTLKIYPDRVAYESAETGAHSRYWRYSDIQSFSHPTRYRFEVTTFEDKFGGPTKVYDFQLKEDLPTQAYDYVWVRVNPAELYPYGSGATRDALAANRPAREEGRPRPESRSPNPEPVTAPVVEGAREREAPRERQDGAEVQTVKVILGAEGYRPASFNLKQGVPARIEFVRQVEGACGEEVVIPEYGVKRELPLNKSVVVEFTPDKPGEYVFTCGMKMLRGKIVVLEKEDSPAVIAVEPRPLEENKVRKEEAPEVAAEAKLREESRTRIEKSKVQTARVIVAEQGYKPDSIGLRRGIPARVTFVRQAEGTCGTEIVLPAQGIKRALPLNKPVVVGFTPNKSGEFSFTCGMGMLRGKIVVQER
jgi:plastocyanin domain-containing protein